MNHGEEYKMIYCCSNCRYVFEEDAEPGYCPDCGKDYICYATGKEIQEYLEYQKEFYPEKVIRPVVMVQAG